MARAKKDILEAIKNGRTKEASGSPSGSEPTDREQVGGESGREAGQGTESVGEQDNETRSEQQQPREESGSDRERAKRTLLESIRSQKHQGSSPTSDDEHRDPQGELQTTPRTDGGEIRESGLVVGTSERHGEQAIGDDRQDTRDSISSNGDSGSPETDRQSGIKDKPKGVGVKPPKNLFTQDVSKPISPPINLEEVLTKKEATELKPRIESALTVAFEYMDKGIGFTTKNPNARDVVIWSSISPSEISVIAGAMLEGGQKSKVMATLTRRVARDYTKLQLTIITVPRLIMSVQHYLSNGFALPFGR
jgi:hypothetical protein